MPFVAERWAITDDPARTVLAGQSLGGLAATHAGLHASHRFGLILSQSGSFWWPGGPRVSFGGDALIDEYAAAPRVPVRFFQEAGSNEREVLDQNRRLRDLLRERGYDGWLPRVPGRS